MAKRKPNRYARGNRYELKVKKQLEQLGYWVYKPVRTRFAKKDIFGLFDLIWYDPKWKVLGFTQLTTDKYIAKQRALKYLKDFDVKHLIFNIESPEITFIKSGDVINFTKKWLDEQNTASEGEAP